MVWLEYGMLYYGTLWDDFALVFVNAICPQQLT